MWGLWVWIPPGSQEWISQGVHSFFVSISIGRNNHNQLFFKKKQHILPILHSTLYIIYSAGDAHSTATDNQEKRFHPKKQNRPNPSSTPLLVHCCFVIFSDHSRKTWRNSATNSCYVRNSTDDNGMLGYFPALLHNTNNRSRQSRRGLFYSHCNMATTPKFLSFPHCCLVVGLSFLVWTHVNPKETVGRS